MLRALQSCGRLRRGFRKAFSTFSGAVREEESEGGDRRRPYQKLFSSSFELTPKLPSQNVLAMLRARGITRMMASNHALKHQAVLQAHIECLYSLISRMQPSMEAVTLFVEYVYNVMLQLQSPSQDKVADAKKRSLQRVLKPTLMCKFVHICEAIDPFYNEYMRHLLSMFIISTLKYSKANQKTKQSLLSELQRKKQIVMQGTPICIEPETQLMLTSANLDKYQQQQLEQIEQNYPTLSHADLYAGIEYVLNFNYYNEEFLTIALNLVINDRTQHSLSLTALRLKTITALHKYRHHKKIIEVKDDLFGHIYDRSIQRYFELLQDNATLFNTLHNQDRLIQTGLLTEFLNPEHYTTAKRLYMTMFKKILNTFENGALLYGVSRIRGIFEVVLIMYTHEDTAQVHQLLSLYQKTISVFPLSGYCKLDPQMAVADKYGYKSEVMAQSYYQQLMGMKSKLARNIGLIHKVHHYSRQLQLAHKMLLYLRVVKQPSREHLQEVNQIIAELFDPNIWLCLGQADNYSHSFLNNPAFWDATFFIRASLTNISADSNVRRQIQKLAQKLQVRSISKHYSQVVNDLNPFLNKFNLRIDHQPSWRQNHHARLASILQLAVHYFDHLTKSKPHQSYIFLNSFFHKIIANPAYYRIIKSNYAYPDVLLSMHDLICRNQKLNNPLLLRDIQAIKRVYAQALQNNSRNPPQHKLYYQEGLSQIEVNRAMIPYFLDIYNISGVAGSAAQGFFHQAIRRNYSQKETLKMQIQTFCKFHKEEGIKVQLNYFEYPYLADLKLTIQNTQLVLLFNMQNTQKDDFMNTKQLEMQQESAAYWKSKDYQVIYIRNDQDMEELLQHKIKKVNAKKE